VLRLAEVQSLVRVGIITGEISRLAPLLLGGRYPERRFAIHERNYETSLVAALVTKFPATVWLTGSRFVTEAAHSFVREYPPQAPCIAEYGRTFPRFLSSCPGADRTPYLHDFAELEWHVGRVAIAVDEAAISLHELSSVSADALLDAGFTLQSGFCYVRTSWPVDELMKLYLKDSAPDHFSIDALDVWLELRGARGEFDINRLDAAQYAFRKSISDGRSLGAAAESALLVDAGFDPGQALAALVAAGLVTALQVRRNKS